MGFEPGNQRENSLRNRQQQSSVSTVSGELGRMKFASVLIRVIYTVRLCRMRQAYDKPTTRIVSGKSNLKLAYDCRVRHKKCHRILRQSKCKIKYN